MQKAAQLATRAARRFDRLAVRLERRARAHGAEFYDTKFRDSPEYSKHYTASIYYPLWTVICDRLRPVPSHRVIELGCGPGQLAQMLTDRGLTQYLGLDFSREAIAAARARCPTLDFDVRDITAFEWDVAERPSVVIATEVLEHISPDLEVLEGVPTGVRVVGSVPNYPAESHLRIFQDEGEVSARYGGVLSDLSVTSIPLTADRRVIYLVDGVAR